MSRKNLQPSTLRRTTHSALVSSSSRGNPLRPRVGVGVHDLGEVFTYTVSGNQDSRVSELINIFEAAATRAQQISWFPESD